MNILHVVLRYSYSVLLQTFRFLCYTAIEDTITWEIKSQKVKFFNMKKLDRHEYITCGSYLNQSENPRL